MILKKVGFFKELPHGDLNGESLSNFAGKLDLSELDNIVNYLNSGVHFIVAPGLTYDSLSSRKKIIGSLSILTDGVWAWPSDLSYYVKEYAVDLPADFLKHMKMNSWRLGNVSLEELTL